MKLYSDKRILKKSSNPAVTGLQETSFNFTVHWLPLPILTTQYTDTLWNFRSNKCKLKLQLSLFDTLKSDFNNLFSNFNNNPLFSPQHSMCIVSIFNQAGISTLPTSLVWCWRESHWMRKSVRRANLFLAHSIYFLSCCANLRRLDERISEKSLNVWEIFLWGYIE